MDRFIILLFLLSFGNSVGAFAPAFGNGFPQRKRCPQELVQCPEAFVLNWTECLCYGQRKEDVFLNPWRKIQTDFWTDLEAKHGQLDDIHEETDVMPLTAFRPTVTVFNFTVFNPTMFNWTTMDPAMLYELQFNPTVFYQTAFNQTMSNFTWLYLTTCNFTIVKPTALFQTVFSSVLSNLAVYEMMFNPTVFSLPVFRSTVLCSSSWIQDFIFSLLLWLQGASAAVLPWHPAYLVLVEPAVWAVGLGVTVIQLVGTKRELARTHAAMGEYRSQEEVFLSWWRSHEEENSVLRKRQRFLRNAAKAWKGKQQRLHRLLKEKRKILRDEQDATAGKDRKIKVLSDLLLGIETTFDPKRGDSRGLADNATLTERVFSASRNVQQLRVDVYRVEAELAVAKQQRDTYRGATQEERRAREALERKWCRLDHDMATLKNEKSQMEKQLHALQQQNKDLADMFQQKEVALQRRLVSEELDRRQTVTARSERNGRSQRAERDAEMDAEFYQDQISAWEEVFKSSLDSLHILMDEQRGALQHLMEQPAHRDG